MMTRYLILVVGSGLCLTFGLAIHGCASQQSATPATAAPAAPAAAGAAAQSAASGALTVRDLEEWEKCPKGSKNKQPWPDFPGSKCRKGCGPDGIGISPCDKVDAATCGKDSAKCRKECPTGDCMVCRPCVFPEFTGEYACYAPPSSAPPSCAPDVAKGNACSQGSPMCTRPRDGEPGKFEACVCCNEKGTWGCGLWEEKANTWKL